MASWLRREDFVAARRRVADAVHRTPLLRFRTLGRSNGARPWLKCENLQKTGSFKVRGALNKVLAAGEAARGGVVTVSAGNHAQALAWAAGCVDVPCAVVMPAGASETKARASAGYGAEVVVADDVHQAFALAESLAAQVNQERPGTVRLNYSYVSRSDDMLLSMWARPLGLTGVIVANAHTTEETAALDDVVSAAHWIPTLIAALL